MIFGHVVAVAAALLVVCVIFLAICAAFVTENVYDSDSPFYRFVLNTATGAALKVLRIRIHTSGMEKLPKDTEFLLVGNHRSNYDPLVTWYALRHKKIAFVSKEENFKIPIFGRIIRKCCFMPIDRKDPFKALETVKRAAALLKKGEVSVGVYPEGTRSKTCELLPFHDGVFTIARKADAPIVVATICGTEKIHKNIPFRHSDVWLEIVDVISAQEVHSVRTNEIGAKVRAIIVESLDGSEGESDEQKVYTV